MWAVGAQDQIAKPEIGGQLAVTPDPQTGFQYP